MLSATFFDVSARRGDVPPKYRPLKAERIIEYRTVEEQLPATTKHKAVVSKAFAAFEQDRIAFERFAKRGILAQQLEILPAKQALKSFRQ